MNEENKDKCPCGKNIKGLNEHNLKKHREFCFPYKSSNSQPKLIGLKSFLKNFSIKNNFAKEKSNENVIAGVSKTPSQEINDVVDEI